MRWTRCADFLERNPDDVVTLIVQDAISTEDTVAVFDAAGLDDLVVHHDPRSRGRRSASSIDRGERLVVFAEDERPPPDWYVNAFEAMQETPFLFLSPDELSCAPNRGGTAGRAVPDEPLDPAHRPGPGRLGRDQPARRAGRAGAAVRAGARPAPNYLAVNFYNIGDVVAAADTLNGVR